MGIDSHLSAARAHQVRPMGAPLAPPASPGRAASPGAPALTGPYPLPGPTALSRPSPLSHHVDRPAFFADVKALELRLAIIDDRFERLACRPDEVYQDWRRDTVTKIRALAVRARMLDDASDLERHHRDRVAALLLTLRHRVGALDARHAAFADRRFR